MDPRVEMLEQIYSEARKRSVVGRPAVELPTDAVMVDILPNGRVFVDLRIIIDAVQAGLK
jgi:hypothetical protein